MTILIDSMYDNMEDRILMHNAICKYLGDNRSPETYVSTCAEMGIEVPIYPPAYRWEP